jgi:hypothetical protein
VWKAGNAGWIFASKREKFRSKIEKSRQELSGTQWKVGN